MKKYASNNDFLIRNLNRLADESLETADTIEQSRPDGAYEITISRSGVPVPVRNGISLHSRIDPEAEAVNLIGNWLSGDQNRQDALPIVFGFGFGYHVKELLVHFSKLTVVEPDPWLLRLAFQNLDLSWMENRVCIKLAGQTPVIQSGDKPRLMVHRPTERLHPEKFAAFQRSLIGSSDSATSLKRRDSLKIITVPPIKGGSAPIARYVARTFQKLGCSVIAADMTPLESYYKKLYNGHTPEKEKEKTYAHIMKYCDDYINQLVESERPDLLFALAQAPVTRKLLTKLRSKSILTAFWFVEDFRYFKYYKTVAPFYDFFFHIQGDVFEEELRRIGANKTYYLPPAAEPDIFRPLDGMCEPNQYDAKLSFMGAGYPNRQKAFKELTGYEFKIWGTGWDMRSSLSEFVQNDARYIETEETVRIYNASKINLNLHATVFNRLIDPGGLFVNPRTFEIAACGAFQLVDERPFLSRHFDIANEMAVFGSLNELKEKIDFFLAHDDMRRELAENAQKRVLAEHTYSHRLSFALDVMSASA